MRPRKFFVLMAHFRYIGVISHLRHDTGNAVISEYAFPAQIIYVDAASPFNDTNVPIWTKDCISARQYGGGGNQMHTQCTIQASTDERI